MTTTSIGDHLVGSLLDGRYRVIQRLARGGMATVYRATDSRLGRAVAIKVMHQGLGDDQDFARKFDREARSAAKLNHPNVVSVFDQGNDAGRAFIVMEYVSGFTLRTLISAEAPMDPLRALELIDDILSALCAAHDSGLVHRDIKPENVLISDRGQLKVADFGLSRAVTSQTVTQGVLIGTVSYLPPELVQHGRADPRADIYSAGVVLFELLTGTKPYTGATPIQVAYAHVHNQVPPPSTRLTTTWQTSRVGIPPYVDALVRAATQRDPDKRPKDARAMQRMVRKAKTALAAGVMDDSALTTEFKNTFAPDEDTGSWATADDGFVVEADALPEYTTSPETSDTPLAELLDQSEPVEPVCAPSPPVSRSHTRRPRTSVRHTPASPSSAGQVPVTVRRRRLLALALLTLFTVVGSLGWWLLDGRYIETPGFTGMAEAAAQDAAEAQGLILQTDRAYSETVPPGRVISSDPAAGIDILRGGTVHAVVSKGPERYGMPTVVGLERDAAVTLLTDNHLVVGTVNEDWHEELAPGVVTWASAEPDELLRRDQRVDLTLSKGPKPIQVPDYRGKSAKDAQADFERLGLEVTVRTANSPTVPEGQVISQRPASGVLNRGDNVTLVRSVGPALKALPEVMTKPVAEATVLLTQAGFKVTTQPAEGFADLGIVVRTDPPAGQQIPEGSEVVLFVN